MRYYPIYLDLVNQPAVVLGGGELACQKAATLLEAGATVTVVAGELCANLESMVASGQLLLEPRPYLPGDLAGARLVIDATGDEDINRKAWQEAEASGILINVLDRPQRCRFIAPAIVRRDPLLVAISTSGESPYLASALRARLERTLGREWGPFTALLGRVRRGLRAAEVPLARQTAIYRRLLTSDIRDLLRQGRLADASYKAAAIVSAEESGRPGRVALVGAGPGDAGLLTLAARDLLAEAEYVFHDALVQPAVLELCGPDAKLINVGKRAGRSSPAQDGITARMLDLAHSGHDVVRLKGGDPFVFGRGGEEMAALVRAGIEVLVVPGVSAALAAPAAAGIPLTMRGLASSVAIVSGHQAGSGASLGRRLESLAAAAETLVVLMPLANLAALVTLLLPVLGAERPAALVAGATTAGQRVVRAPLGQIHLCQVEGPATLVIGAVVDAIPSAELGAGLSASGLLG